MLPPQGTTFGNTNIYSGVAALTYTYNAQGLPFTQTSYNSTTISSGNVVNQVENLYNGFGQLTNQYQAVSGNVYH